MEKSKRFNCGHDQHDKSMNSYVWDVIVESENRKGHIQNNNENSSHDHR